MSQSCFCSSAPNFLTAYVAPSGTLIVAMIAYRQWKTARDKLRLDLYDRRFKVFRTASDYWKRLIALNSAGMSAERQALNMEYNGIVEEAQFLFSTDSGTQGVLQEIKLLSIDFESAYRKIHIIPPNVEILPSISAPYIHAEKRLDESQKALTIRMAKYLNFHDLQA